MKEETASIRKRTVLLVDDNVELLESLRRQFRAVRDSWVVETALNGKEALQVVSRVHVDVVLTDILMPEKDGLELVREVRRSYPHIKMIAMSGGGRRVGLQPLGCARMLGAHLTLEKPFEFSGLMEALRRLVTPFRGSGEDCERQLREE